MGDEVSMWGILSLWPYLERDAGLIHAGGEDREGGEAGEQGLTLVHFSAQPEAFLTQNTP